MGIHLSRTVNTDQWAGLVAGNGKATFFHGPEWSELLVSALDGLEALHLSARADGKLVGVLPLIRQLRGPISALDSLTYGTYGGPVVDPSAPPETAGLLVSEFAALAGSPMVAHAQIVDRFGVLESTPSSGSRVIEDAVQVVSLDRDYEQLKSSFRPSCRNKVRKARRAGVAVRRAETREDFLAYWSLLAVKTRRWNVRPAIGARFFSAMSELSPDLVQMWHAVHDGDLIAGDLNFVRNGIIMNWGNVTAEGAQKFAPANLLHATAIEEGVREGERVYDLGGSAGIEGVHAFKASFGAEDVPIRRFVIDKGWYRAVRSLTRR